MSYARDRVTRELLETRSNKSISDDNSFPPNPRIVATAEDAIEMSQEWEFFCNSIKIIESWGKMRDWTDEQKRRYERYLKKVETPLQEKWEKLLKRLPATGRPLRRIIYVEDILQGCKNE